MDAIVPTAMQPGAIAVTKAFERELIATCQRSNEAFEALLDTPDRRQYASEYWSAAVDAYEQKLAQAEVTLANANAMRERLAALVRPATDSEIGAAVLSFANVFHESEFFVAALLEDISSLTPSVLALVVGLRKIRRRNSSFKPLPGEIYQAIIDATERVASCVDSLDRLTPALVAERRLQVERMRAPQPEPPRLSAEERRQRLKKDIERIRQSEAEREWDEKYLQIRRQQRGPWQLEDPASDGTDEVG